MDGILCCPPLQVPESALAKPKTDFEPTKWWDQMYQTVLTAGKWRHFGKKVAQSSVQMAIVEVQSFSQVRYGVARTPHDLPEFRITCTAAVLHQHCRQSGMRH